MSTGVERKIVPAVLKVAKQLNNAVLNPNAFCKQFTCEKNLKRLKKL